MALRELRKALKRLSDIREMVKHSAGSGLWEIGKKGLFTLKGLKSESMFTLSEDILISIV